MFLVIFSPFYLFLALQEGLLSAQGGIKNDNFPFLRFTNRTFVLYIGQNNRLGKE